ncbi:MAG: pyridoxamine 5'-phosphate oxidase family protein, partial [Actinomycetota bacterium]|nr:pyridoxamine 5'-phosphate oxidase family protein [Actinomycetota bacterium]
DLVARLGAARNYWLTTVDAAGAPHAVPVWGVVVGDRLHLYASRSSQKAHHVSRDPRVALHLESAEDVVIVDGHLEDLGRPAEHPGVMAALDAKYPDDADYLPSHDSYYDALYRLEPSRARTWALADFDGSQRRWSAGG